MSIAFENLFHKIRSQDPKKTGDPKWKILMVTQKGEEKQKHLFKIIYYLISLNKDANSKILNIKIGLFY